MNVKRIREASDVLLFVLCFLLPVIFAIYTITQRNIEPVEKVIYVTDVDTLTVFMKEVFYLQRNEETIRLKDWESHESKVVGYVIPNSTNLEDSILTVHADAWAGYEIVRQWEVVNE